MSVRNSALTFLCSPANAPNSFDNFANWADVSARFSGMAISSADSTRLRTSSLNLGEVSSLSKNCCSVTVSQTMKPPSCKEYTADNSPLRKISPFGRWLPSH